MDTDVSLSHSTHTPTLSPRCDCVVCAARRTAARVGGAIGRFPLRLMRTVGGPLFNCLAGVVVIAPAALGISSAVGFACGRLVPCDFDTACQIVAMNLRDYNARGSTFAMAGLLGGVVLGLSYAPQRGYLASAARSALHRSIVFATAGAAAGYLIERGIWYDVRRTSDYAFALAKAHIGKGQNYDASLAVYYGTWEGVAIGAMAACTSIAACFVAVKAYDVVVGAVTRALTGAAESRATRRKARKRSADIASTAHMPMCAVDNDDVTVQFSEDEVSHDDDDNDNDYHDDDCDNGGRDRRCHFKPNNVIAANGHDLERLVKVFVERTLAARQEQDVSPTELPPVDPVD